jgi:hypothetical protein
MCTSFAHAAVGLLAIRMFYGRQAPLRLSCGVSEIRFHCGGPVRVGRRRRSSPYDSIRLVAAPCLPRTCRAALFANF